MYRDLKGEIKITLSFKTHYQEDFALAKQWPFKGDFCSGIWDMLKRPSHLSEYTKKGRLQVVRKKIKVLPPHSKIDFKICF